MQDAIEVFARGFSFTRSFTHPYIPEQLEQGIWVVRDAPHEKGQRRKEEYIGHGVSPVDLDATARKHTRGHYHICAVLEYGESDTKLRSDFKELGYRLAGTEAFMVHDLRQIESVPEPVPVSRVTTLEVCNALAKAARSRQILPEYLDAEPAPMREYVATDGDQLVGWVGSVRVNSYCWCTNMHVVASHRRRGIARALMTRMLQDDKETGANANVLLASHVGSKLYPVVGYRQIGQLYIYVPRK